MPSTEDWIATNIDDCRPSGARSFGGINELLRALAFLDGKATQVFGMAANRSGFLAPDRLRERCVDAVREWFAKLGREDALAQVELYEFVTRHGMQLELPEPPLLAAVRKVEQDRVHQLETLGKPSAQLAPSLAAELGKLHTAAQRGALTAAASNGSLPEHVAVSNFEWLDDDWHDVAGPGLDPALLAIAGADGNYLALLIDRELAAAGHTPIVYYFHEEDPAYTFVFESCAAMAAVLAGKSTARGEQHPAVTAAIARLNDGASGDARSTFALRHAQAQRVCNEAERQIQAARR